MGEGQVPILQLHVAGAFPVCRVDVLRRVGGRQRAARLSFPTPRSTDSWSPDLAEVSGPGVCRAFAFPLPLQFSFRCKAAQQAACLVRAQRAQVGGLVAVDLAVRFYELQDHLLLLERLEAPFRGLVRQQLVPQVQLIGVLPLSLATRAPGRRVAHGTHGNHQSRVMPPTW